MQTFLVDSSFSVTATILDMRRLNKQRVEALQILNTLLYKGPYFCPSCNAYKHHTNPYKTGYKCYDCECQMKKTPWYFHPCVQQWEGYEYCLSIYGSVMCGEWIKRGYKDTILPKFNTYIEDCQLDIKIGRMLFPKWLNENRLFSSHRAALLAKNFDYYKQFNWPESPKIDYFWPTKNSVDKPKN